MAVAAKKKLLQRQILTGNIQTHHGCSQLADMACAKCGGHELQKNLKLKNPTDLSSSWMKPVAERPHVRVLCLVLLCCGHLLPKHCTCDCACDHACCSCDCNCLSLSICLIQLAYIDHWSSFA